MVRCRVLRRRFGWCPGRGLAKQSGYIPIPILRSDVMQEERSDVDTSSAGSMSCLEIESSKPLTAIALTFASALLEASIMSTLPLRPSSDES